MSDSSQDMYVSDRYIDVYVQDRETGELVKWQKRDGLLADFSFTDAN